MNIGDKHQGYKIIANVENRFVIGYSSRALAPYVVWFLDSRGKPCAGNYFHRRKDAIADFVSRGFGYYD